jgi:hypothetical protein
MFDTYQEHLDHELGAFANELQAGYALSQIYQPRRVADPAEIDRLIRNGFTVVVVEVARYCGHTDALLPGCDSYIAGAHPTRALALAAVEAAYGDDDEAIIRII